MVAFHFDGVASVFLCIVRQTRVVSGYSLSQYNVLIVVGSSTLQYFEAV